MTLEMPVGTRYVQLRGAAVAVTPEERVYLVRGGRAVELIAQADPAESDESPGGEGLGMAVGELTGDGS